MAASPSILPTRRAHSVRPRTFRSPRRVHLFIFIAERYFRQRLHFLGHALLVEVLLAVFLENSGRGRGIWLFYHGLAHDRTALA
jgi:hypothetical protein